MHLRRFAALAAVLIATVSVTTAQPPAPKADEKPLKIDGAARAEVVEALAKELEENYVFPDKAQAMAAALRTKLSDKGYDSFDTGQALAKQLTTDLRAVAEDRHLRVNCSTEPLPKAKGGPAPGEMRTMQAVARRRNANLVKLEWLPGNVGYLELRSFMPPEALGEPLAAAMNFLANTDALIIDLRRNGGGSPGGVRLLCSYLFPAEPKVHLNSLYFRPRDETEEFWTLTKELPAKRYVDKDVYVLTSKFTFSGAEECAYNLQTRKRATLVGETTGGGAHPGGRARLNDHFFAFIPTGRAINPVTGTNWELVGVKPEVRADADEALETAHQLALKKLRESAKNVNLLDEELAMQKSLEKRYEGRKESRRD